MKIRQRWNSEAFHNLHLFKNDAQKNFILMSISSLFFLALLLASFECEPPENSHEKEQYKHIKYVFIGLNNYSDELSFNFHKNIVIFYRNGDT